MKHRDPAYEQEERIVFGLPGLLVLIGFLLGVILFATGCASGPIRRALDSELGVLCYYTNTAMSCIPVQIKKRGQKTDKAKVDPAGQPASAGGAE
jgi:hypothetical protein